MPKLIKQIKTSEFFRSIFTLISATSIAQLIGILIYPILTDIYSPSEHGTFALYLSIITITGIICTGKYDAAIMMPAKKKSAINLAALSVIIAFLFSIIILILIVLFNRIFTSWLGDHSISKWLYFVPLSTFMIGIFQTFSFLSNREKQYSRIALSNVTQSISNSAVKISTSKLISTGGGLIAGAITGQVIGSVIFLWGFFKKEVSLLGEISFSEMKKAAFEYSFFPRYNLMHNFINNFSGNLPVFVLSYFYSSSEVGLYSLGFIMIFRPMNLITVSFTQVFSQKIISKFNNEQKIYSDIRKIAFNLFKFGLPIFLIAGIFGPGIFNYIFGNIWISAGKYMQILLPWLFIVFISAPLSFLPDMLKRQKKAMWLDIFKFVVRLAALGLGIYLNKLYLAIALFSGVSTIFTLYNLYWYISLSKKADNKDKREKISGIERNLLLEDRPEF